MGQILLVRHGQASFGADDYDALSPLGFEQARLLGKGLAARAILADTVVTGTMRRHRETAQGCLEAAGWDPAATLVDEGWDEFDFLRVLAVHPGLAEAQTDKAVFQRWFEEATAAWIAGEDRDYAETFAAFCIRVGGAMERTVALARSGGTVAVFSSGGPIAWAVSALLVDEASAEVRAELWNRLNRMAVNSALTRLLAGSRGVNLLSYNEQSHLDGVPGALSYR
jgi:broad specificity phosphatase PhoE